MPLPSSSSKFSRSTFGFLSLHSRYPKETSVKTSMNVCRSESKVSATMSTLTKANQQPIIACCFRRGSNCNRLDNPCTKLPQGVTFKRANVCGISRPASAQGRTTCVSSMRTQAVCKYRLHALLTFCARPYMMQAQSKT